jgi:hypothetical protein
MHETVMNFLSWRSSCLFDLSRKTNKHPVLVGLYTTGAKPACIACLLLTGLIFVLFYCLLWPLHCLSFINWRRLIILLVSLNIFPTDFSNKYVFLPIKNPPVRSFTMIIVNYPYLPGSFVLLLTTAHGTMIF